jgi:hypothetical protein
MRSETSAGIEYQNEYKKIAYTQEFRDFFKEHKKELVGILELMKRLDALDEDEIVDNIFEVGDDIKITVLKAIVWDENDPRRYHLRIDIEDNSFFVKSEAVPQRGKGYDEYTNIKEAKELLKNLEGVEVIEPQLGYQHTDGRTFFVSKWNSLPNLKDVLDERKDDEKLRQRIDKIKKVLEDAGFHDVGTHNMFYDKERDVIIVFDLFKSPQWLY